MVQHEVYSKIQKSRQNMKYRQDRPYHNFRLKTSKSEKFLKKTLATFGDSATVREALSQFVISDISAFEVYFKDVFCEVFEFLKEDTELIQRCAKAKLVDRTFTLDDLIIITNDKIKISEIILGCQNFQNLDNINKVFSVIVDEKIFDLLNNNNFYRGEPKFPEKLKKYSMSIRSDWYPLMQEYLELRHTLIHDYTPRKKMNVERIFELHGNLEWFILAMDICIFFNFVHPRSYYLQERQRSDKKLGKKPHNSSVNQ